MSYVFNEAVSQFFPALLSVRCVFLEDLKFLQVLAVVFAQLGKVDQLLTEEKFQELPEGFKNQ